MPESVRHVLDAGIWREFGYVGWALVVTAGFGLWATAIGVPRPDYAPGWSGWAVTIVGWALVALGAVGIAGRWREEQFQKSPALDLVLEGDGSLCVWRFNAGVGGPSGVPAPSADDATTLRLHVVNLRRRRLSRVRVQLDDALSDDGLKAHPHSSWLRWMHDVSGTESFGAGKDVEPGGDPHSYVDIATRADRDSGFYVDFAATHLRNMRVPGNGPLRLDVTASGVDETTGRAVPDCHRSFVVTVGSNGRPAIERL